jgi:hypothetical protein
LADQEKINEAAKPEYQIIQDALKQGLHWNVVDFDAHLENVGLDFTNKFLSD